MLEVPSGAAGVNYSYAVTLFAISTLIELLAEPIWILSQIHMYIKLKVRIL